jgi:hypothetical protein
VKSAVEEEQPLTFAWPKRRGLSWQLPLFLVLSLFAHAATFFIFQVDPQRATIPPPAPQVSLLTPSTPENKTLLNWIESEDPALGAATAHAPVKGLAELAYHPSFATIRTPPRILSPEPEKVPFPSGRDPLDMIRGAAPSATAAPAARAPSVTRVILSGGLAGRSFAKEPVFSALSSTPLDAAHFLLGVNQAGQVIFVFPQRPSGNPSADPAAAAALAQASFVPSHAAIAWGFATVEWGDDAYRPTTTVPPGANAK